MYKVLIEVYRQGMVIQSVIPWKFTLYIISTKMNLILPFNLLFKTTLKLKTHKTLKELKLINVRTNINLIKKIKSNNKVIYKTFN